MAARTLVVWGASSGAGKSFVTTALCRWAANQGLDVAPFKAQNMSNNARVVACGDGTEGEIGSAQYFQALAARQVPSVDMNPVLLKPESDRRSQVVVRGRVASALLAAHWVQRSETLARAAQESFERLHRRHQLLVVEGAGSPAEINLAASDYVNLGTARWARAAGPTHALLVVDIDRGGAFAHAVGTWQLLPDDLSPLLRGFLFNRFRGDASLLESGQAPLLERTGLPLLGVLPMQRAHGLPEEDGVMGPPPLRMGARWRIAIVAAPALSNHDEFQPLLALPQVQVVWAREPQDLAGADGVILPGSKQASGDLRWLRATGLAAAVVAHARAGRAVLGICGGLQLLGACLDDPEGVDGEVHGPLQALGLLPLHTRYAAPKRVRRGRFRFNDGLNGPWAALRGLAWEGYEIRCGRTEGEAAGVLHADDGPALGWQQGSVLGVYAHGLLESPAVLRALFDADAPPLDTALDALAEALEAALGRERLHALCA